MWEKRWIELGWHYEWMEIVPSKVFWQFSDKLTKDFSEYVEKILDWVQLNDSKLTTHISEAKDNDLLITIYTKVNSIIPELLWLVKNQNSIKMNFDTIQKRYNLEKSDFVPVLKIIISDIISLWIWLQAKWIDEEFNSFLENIEKKWNWMYFWDLIDFITIIESAILESIKSHIEWQKYKEWNEEKLNKLLSIFTLERKRLIEQYLYKKDNVENFTKARIITALFSEESFDIEKNSIDNYIMYITRFRSRHLKSPYFDIK